MTNAELLNAIPDDVLVDLWARSPESHRVRELLGISQVSLRRWTEGTPAQRAKVADAIRRAYQLNPPEEPATPSLLLE